MARSTCVKYLPAERVWIIRRGDSRSREVIPATRAGLETLTRALPVGDPACALGVRALFLPRRWFCGRRAVFGRS